MTTFRTGILAVAVTIALSPAPHALALDLFEDIKPQATTQTCQSYAIMLALAALGDDAFPINNFEELRDAEKEFRAVAEGVSGGPYGHDALKKAVSQYTSGAYDLVIETGISDLPSYMQRVKELTRLTSTGDALIADLTGSDFVVVLSSFTRIATSNYATGHIVAILGVAGSGLDSSSQLLMFNSAIKGQGGSVNMCAPGDEPGDYKYQAGVVLTNDFELKSFPDFRLLYLRKN